MRLYSIQYFETRRADAFLCVKTPSIEQSSARQASPPAPSPPSPRISDAAAVFAAAGRPERTPLQEHPLRLPPPRAEAGGGRRVLSYPAEKEARSHQKSRPSTAAVAVPAATLISRVPCGGEEEEEE